MDGIINGINDDKNYYYDAYGIYNYSDDAKITLNGRNDT